MTDTSEQNTSSPFAHPASPERSEVAVLILAAGQGVRLGGRRKQFRVLGGRSLLVQTLLVFAHHPEVDHLIVAVPPDAQADVEQELDGAGMPKRAAVVAGGPTRQASVAAALRALPPSAGIVLVHDAVRPFVEPAQIAAVIGEVRSRGAAALAVPVTDTVRRGEDGRFGAIVPRAGLYRMQTPQGFRRDWFEQAHAEARRQGRQATDDVALVQQAGYPVSIVPGSALNLKITTPEDWELAQLLWTHRKA